jgi:hypothetical protein
MIVVGIGFDAVAHDEQIWIGGAICSADPDPDFGRQDDARPSLERAADERRHSSDQSPMCDRADRPRDDLAVDVLVL